MKIRQLEAELFPADRHVTKLKIAFRNFANVPKNCSLSKRCIFVFYVDPEKTDVTSLCSNKLLIFYNLYVLRCSI
jgi:hypothetical protein